MSDPTAVNHHADKPGFAGVTGLLFGLVFLLTGRRNARRATALTAVTAADHVVDIGCGPGSAARAAARRGARVTGVDPAPTLLFLARAVTRRGAATTWAKGSAEAIPVSDGAATVVWALATVHHWQDVSKGLAEVHRTLAPGGRLLAIERQSPPGATGFASHGWTAQQVESFAALCRTAGLVDVVIGGGQGVWTVLGVRP